MREAYCDESETTAGGRQLLVLAGYLASADQWHAFEREWSADVLERFNIPYFHTKELRSRNARLYRHLEMDKRRELVVAACGVIGKHVEVGMAVCLHPSDWKSVTTPDQRSRWGGAYGLCTELLLTGFDQFVNAAERISVFLEDGHSNAGEALQRLRQYQFDTEPMEWPREVEVRDYPGESSELRMRDTAMRIGSIGLVGKRSCLQVQAADLFAYVVATTLSGMTGAFDDLWDALIAGTKHGVAAFNLADLRELARTAQCTEDERRRARGDLYGLKRALRNEGFQTYQLPWGVIVDKGPGDAESIAMRDAAQRITRKLNAIALGNTRTATSGVHQDPDKTPTDESL